MSVHISKFSLYFISLNQTKEKKILFAFADCFSDIQSRVILNHFSPHTPIKSCLEYFPFHKRHYFTECFIYLCISMHIELPNIFLRGLCDCHSLSTKNYLAYFLFHFYFYLFLKKKKNQFWLSYNPFFTRLSGSVDFHVQKSGLQQQNILRVVIPFDNGGKFKPV
jgi:hypothetical protein